jgi:hypothetical protein
MVETGVGGAHDLLVERSERLAGQRFVDERAGRLFEQPPMKDIRRLQSPGALPREPAPSR